jgi:hypothetical protein
MVHYLISALVLLCSGFAVAQVPSVPSTELETTTTEPAQFETQGRTSVFTFLRRVISDIYAGILDFVYAVAEGVAWAFWYMMDVLLGIVLSVLAGVTEVAAPIIPQTNFLFQSYIEPYLPVMNFFFPIAEIVLMAIWLFDAFVVLFIIKFTLKLIPTIW